MATALRGSACLHTILRQANSLPQTVMVRIVG